MNAIVSKTHEIPAIWDLVSPGRLNFEPDDAYGHRVSPGAVAVSWDYIVRGLHPL